MLQKEKQQQEEQIKEEGTNISEVTKNMVDVLSQSTNPKHRNCKFLKFLNKLNHGAYEIKDDQLVKHPDKIKEYTAIDTKRRELEHQKEVK